MWRHLLQQTSEWSGTLVGIPAVDHNRGINQTAVSDRNKLSFADA